MKRKKVTLSFFVGVTQVCFRSYFGGRIPIRPSSAGQATSAQPQRHQPGSQENKGQV